MGADLILNSIPFCQLTEERKKKITEAVEAVEDKRILAYNEDYLFVELDLAAMDVAYGPGSEDEALAEVVRQDILDACFEVLEQGDNVRDTAVLGFPGMNYRVLVSGGMSWGDLPTEGCELMSKFTGLDPLWDLLQTFSEEDFKWQ